MQIAEANVVSGNTTSNQAVFRPVNASESCSIVVSRDQASTPPVGGTFDIFLENEKVKGKFSSLPLRKYSVFKISKLLVLRLEKYFVLHSVSCTTNMNNNGENHPQTFQCMLHLLSLQYFFLDL